MKFVRHVTRRTKYVLIIVAFGALFLGKRVVYLSADPEGEKDCTPAVPGADDPSKRTTLEVDDYLGKLPWVQKGGVINDASCLNRTEVYGIIQVAALEDIRNALLFAWEKKISVSMAGVKHSMGGQAFSKNGLVLDMTRFNAIHINEEKKTMTVQSGATWHDIQEKLHPRFAVKAMQSTDIFTVGGSISVNAHGMDHQAGALGKSIRSLSIMLADGSVVRASRTERPELFNLVVGGYGLFGVILEAELAIVDNAVYQSERTVIDYADFPKLFDETIFPDSRYGLMYAHLSTGPQSFLKELIVYTYKDTGEKDAVIPPLGEVSGIKFRRFIFNLAKQGSLPMRLKWFAEKHIEPLIENCTVSRNQAMAEGEACFVSRNEPMHDSVPYLRNNLKNDTDILHEYFVPRAELVPFIDDLRETLLAHGANVLNASIRVVYAEDNFLSYAPKDAFSVVLYLNQGTDAESNEKMRRLTRDLIDLTVLHKGRFFLPYQLHYTPEQLLRSYPEIPAFFRAKRYYDPAGIFSNSFYEKYAPVL